MNRKLNTSNKKQIIKETKLYKSNFGKPQPREGFNIMYGDNIRN